MQGQQTTNAQLTQSVVDIKAQLGKLTTTVGALQQERGKFPSQPQANPQGPHQVSSSNGFELQMEHLKAITTVRSDKEIDKTILLTPSQDETSLPSISYDHSVEPPSGDTDKVESGWPEQHVVSNFGIAFLMEQASSIIQTKIVPKYKDPGIGRVEANSVTLQLADHSIRIPRGVVEDVLVQVEKFYFLVDFVVLDMQPVDNLETQILIILGHPFLSASDTFIQCRNGIVRLAFRNMTLE
ncbi:hypothetical protein Acr_00g0071050 [Actinidia rufa]|uniref:Uncharacterized protein n=1 Tax=Actinidia rufa TaxID=165716 RepID=A0A7J0DT74_9ERIC|nr:hypothetical protein Acr_00g0071050 [Actinidia rufa]